MEFKDQLKKVRLKFGMSQKTLAYTAGLPPSAISHFEIGNRRPRLENLIKIADALCISIDYLLGRGRDE